MKLYFSKGTCALAIRITIHELNIPCEFISVDLKAKKLANGDDYLKINPKGVVPVLQLDDGRLLTENIAIQIYLAEKHQNVQLLPAKDDFNRYRVMEWLSYVSTELHKNCSPLFNPDLPKNIKEEIFISLLKKKLAYLEEYFKNNTYLVSDHYTLPDGYLYVVLTWVHHFHIELTPFEKLTDYYNRIKARPSVVQSLAEGG